MHSYKVPGGHWSGRSNYEICKLPNQISLNWQDILGTSLEAAKESEQNGEGAGFRYEI